MTGQDKQGKSKTVRKAEGRSPIPKTAAARKRHLEKVVRNCKRLQDLLAAERREEAALAAAVKADQEKVLAGLQQDAGRTLLAIIANKKTLAAQGDMQAQRNLDYWMGQLDQEITDPAHRELAGLPPRRKAED